ncbi:MAG: glycosyltransferase family 2 protein [Parcubacteria group bacterium]|nr:glycosyltransferase family 2 protein [Parcubacteria group bacterium]
MIADQETDFPKISIVVLNYNGLKYLKQTIPPLLSINYQNYEVVIVDNFSTDTSLKYLESIKSNKLKIIRNKENSGYCKGKNLGISKAQGKYILLLDEDTKIDDDDILLNLYNLCKKLPEIGFLSLLLKEADDTDNTKIYGGFISLFSVFNNKALEIKKLMSLRYHEASTTDGQAFFFKKDIFTKLGGYDISQPYYIDAGDLGSRAAIFGYKTFVYDERIFTHLGKVRKVTKENWLWKYGFNFSGLSRLMFKNYRLQNLLIAYPYFLIFCLLKMLVNLLRYKDSRVITKFLFSVKLFFKNLGSTLQERRKIQLKRTEKKDLFLKIKPPKF